MGIEVLGGALMLAGSIYSAERQSSATNKAAKAASDAAAKQTAAIRQNTVDTIQANAQQFSIQQEALKAQYAEQAAYQQSLQIAAQVSQKAQEQANATAQQAAIDAAETADVNLDTDQSTYVDTTGVRRPIRDKYQVTQAGTANTGSGLSI